QIILDKGQEVDWFATNWIRWFTLISVVTMIAFIIWELHVEQPIVNLRVLANRNFAAGTFLITIFGLVLYATTALLPLFLQNLMGYPALQSGMAVSPRGLGSIIAIIIIGRMIGIIDNRLFITLGFIVLAWSSFLLGKINLSIDMSSVVLSCFIGGIAMG